jgi:polysaccharide biosynthesis protein PelG
MAGIGFELRKLLDRDTYTGLFQAYAYAGIISAGPWVLSIQAILVIGALSYAVVSPGFLINQFQVSVTYLMVGSLILTGLIQLAFTRFVADRLFERKLDWVMPNFTGCLLLVVIASGIIGTALTLVLFPEQSDLYRVLMLAGFVITCCIWTATIFLSGLKRYLEIFGIYLIGYAITVAAALSLRGFGLEGLLLGFVIGHFVLLTGMITLTLREYPSSRLISFEFLEKRAMYLSLVGCGFMYHLAVWVDKIMFWYYPETSVQIIGPLRASPIYDLPIFLAYLAIIPGMAVFLVEMETQFAESFKKFYDAVREGATLDRIENLRDEMVHTIRGGLFEIVKIQSISVLIVFVLGPWVLERMGISAIYVPLLYVDVIAASLQVLLLAILTIFYYLDKRRVVLLLTGICLLLNVVLTGITLSLGPAFYGYGFALALLATVVMSMVFMEKKLATLEYETFMLQRT